MNVIARLEFELAYNDSAVHHINHNTTRHLQGYLLKSQNRKVYHAFHSFGQIVVMHIPFSCTMKFQFRLYHHIIYTCNFVAICLFCFDPTRLYGFFCGALRKRSSFSLKFSFLNHVQVFSCEISPIVVCPVGWDCRIHRLLLCRGVTPPPTSVLDMTLNNLMVRFQQCWSFGECGVPLHCHCSQVHSGSEW